MHIHTCTLYIHVRTCTYMYIHEHTCTYALEPTRMRAPVYTQTIKYGHVQCTYTHSQSYNVHTYIHPLKVIQCTYTHPLTVIQCKYTHPLTVIQVYTLTITKFFGLFRYGFRIGAQNGARRRRLNHHHRPHLTAINSLLGPFHRTCTKHSEASPGA